MIQPRIEIVNFIRTFDFVFIVVIATSQAAVIFDVRNKNTPLNWKKGLWLKNFIFIFKTLR